MAGWAASYDLRVAGGGLEKKHIRKPHIGGRRGEGGAWSRRNRGKGREAVAECGCVSQGDSELHIVGKSVVVPRRKTDMYTRPSPKEGAGGEVSLAGSQAP